MQYLESQGTVGEVRSISTGWETEVYAFSLNDVPMVLRLYQGSHVASRAENEFRMLEHLGRVGYPVPRADRFEPDPSLFGGPFLLMERVEGSLLGRRFREHPRETIEQLCRLMVRLHGMDWKPFVGPGAVWPDLQTARGIFDTAMLTGLLKSADLLEPMQPVIDWIDEQGRAVTPKLSPVHSDFHFDNVLIRPDGSPAVIDWGTTALADPRHDLGYTYVLLATHGSLELAEQVRQTYEAMAGSQEDFDYFVNWALARRMLTMVVVLARGSAALGLRPGLEGMLRRQLPYAQMVTRLLQERTGVRLPGVEALLVE
ncbi:MAG: phosphotransferase family protein [Bacillota bacterium]